MRRNVTPVGVNLPTAPRVPIALDEFMKQMGICRQTCWRWRQQGWIETIEIAGRLYIPAEALAVFNERAANGDFKGKNSGSRLRGRAGKAE